MQYSIAETKRKIEEKFGFFHKKKCQFDPSIPLFFAVLRFQLTNQLINSINQFNKTITMTDARNSNGRKVGLTLGWFALVINIILIVLAFMDFYASGDSFINPVIMFFGEFTVFCSRNIPSRKNMSFLKFSDKITLKSNQLQIFCRNQFIGMQQLVIRSHICKCII